MIQIELRVLITYLKWEKTNHLRINHMTLTSTGEEGIGKIQKLKSSKPLPYRIIISGRKSTISLIKI